MMGITAMLVVVIVFALLLAGVVLFVLGVSNRHTRSATLAVASVLGVMVFCGFAFLFVSNREMAKYDESRAQLELEYQTARAEQRLIDSVEEIEGDTATDTYGDRAAEFENYEYDTAPSFAQTRVEMATGPRIMWSFAPVSILFVLIAALAVLYLIFKYVGSAAGFAVVGMGVLFLGLSFFWVLQRPMVVDNPMDRSMIIDEAYVTAEEFTRGSMDVAANDPPDEASPEPINSDSSSDGEVSGPTRPSWVDQPPRRIKNVYQVPVESSWWSSPAVCNERVEEEITQAVQDFFAEELSIQTGRPKSHHYLHLESFGITSRYIRENIIADRYYETRDIELEDKATNLHVLLEFDEGTRQELLTRWRDRARQDNVILVSVGLTTLMMSLAGVLGLIKLDTYTKGYYTKRLFIGVPAAIIAIIVLFAMFVDL